MRRCLIAAVLLLGTGCATGAGAVGGAATPEAPKPLPRTPVLTWLLDSSLQPTAIPEPGEVVVGDELVVVVDTTQRFGGKATAVDTPFLRTGTAAAGNPIPVFLPPGLRHFYVATRGQDYVLQPAACTPGGPLVARIAGALDCVTSERLSKHPGWERPSTGMPPVPLDVSVCSEKPTDIVPPAGKTQAWSLVQKDPTIAAGNPNHACLTSWMFQPDTDLTVKSVLVSITTDGVTEQVEASANEGVWRLRRPLKAGRVFAEVRITYENGLINNRELGYFSVASQQEYSLVRIQPEIMTSRKFRAVNLAVAVTPVHPEFFKSGPWKNSWFMNGFSPSMVVRFAGDNTTLVQFGVAASFFLNRAMLINTGVLFGSTDTTRYWKPAENFFIGFAIDPILLMELRNTNSSGNSTSTTTGSTPTR
ncbi:MAG TPA: hypothetical protein VF794_04420 [Archangium sp.]|uniref:hypothetical protein n=1 Tax=Archangium sp. TaxID=1872627 RepID=UPI002ED94836